MKAGDLIGGRYEILGELGRGGLGVVFQAKQISTGQLVAVKIIRPEMNNGESMRARFLRETQLVARMRHPNIVRLVDAGALDEELLHAVFEFVEGDSLASHLRDEGRLRPTEAVRLMTQVLEALGAAHEKGVIHRDLKPQNIMVTTAGLRRSAVVLDFGIAAVIDDVRGDDYETLTEQGHTPGTPWYMAPEQFQGAVAPSVDLYAWGLVLIECLTGRRVVEAKTPFKAMFWQATSDAAPIPEWIAEHPLGKILRRAVDKSTSVRYSSAADLLRDLEGCAVQGLKAPEMETHAEQGYAQTLDSPLPASPMSPEMARPTLAPPKASGPALAPDTLAAPPGEDALSEEDDVSTSAPTRDLNAPTRKAIKVDVPRLRAISGDGLPAIDLASERSLPSNKMTRRPDGEEKRSSAMLWIALLLLALVGGGVAVLSSSDAEPEATPQRPTPAPTTMARVVDGVDASDAVAPADVPVKKNVDAAPPVIKKENAHPLKTATQKKAFINELQIFCDDLKEASLSLRGQTLASTDCKKFGAQLNKKLSQHTLTLDTLEQLNGVHSRYSSASTYCKKIAREVIPPMLHCAKAGDRDSIDVSARLAAPSARWLLLDETPSSVGGLPAAYRGSGAAHLPPERVGLDARAFCVALDIHVGMMPNDCDHTAPILGAIVSAYRPMLDLIQSFDAEQLRDMAPSLRVCRDRAFSSLPADLARCVAHGQGAQALATLEETAFFAKVDEAMRPQVSPEVESP